MSPSSPHPQSKSTAKGPPSDATLIATVHNSPTGETLLPNRRARADDEFVDLAADDFGDRPFQRGPFARLSPRVQNLLHREMHPVQLVAGQTLFEQNAPADSLYVIRSGNVGVFTHRSDGSRAELGASAAGDVIGEMALLVGGLRTASVVAKTDAELLALPAASFEELCRGQPAVAQVLTHVMADRLGSHPHDALCAKNLGDYAIEARLGRGGMSVVYAARHCTSRERVAVKMMSHRLIFDPVCCEQFDREAEFIATLVHPNIPALRDRFQAFRTHFLVMELIDGHTLGEFIPSNGLSEEIALGLLGQVADAVQHAHDLGIVHRDLKPSNLMLDRGGHLKLLDFGLAVPPEVAADESLGAAGTLGYMAPEQFGRGRVGPQADFFALGCIAYELLSGHHLFEESNLSAALRRRKTMPSTTFRELLPTAGDTVAKLFEHALHLNPAERHLDLERLKAYANPVPLTAVSP